MSESDAYRGYLRRYLGAQADSDRERIATLRGAARREPEARRAVREVDRAFGPPSTPQTDPLVGRLWRARDLASKMLAMGCVCLILAQLADYESARGALEKVRAIVAHALVGVCWLGVLAGGLIGAGAALRLAREPGWRAWAAAQGARACLPLAALVLSVLYLAMG